MPRFRVIAVLTAALCLVDPARGQIPGPVPGPVMGGVSAGDGTDHDVQSRGGVTAHRITLVVRDATLEETLTQIAAQAALTLSWNQSRVPVRNHITVALHDVTLDEALAAIEHQAGVLVRVQNDGQLVVRKASNARTDVGTITGRVLDTVTHRGIEGATVTIAGTRLSTLTHADGTFSLANVPAGTHTVTVRLLGYVPVTMPVTVETGKSVTVFVTLRSSPSVLAEIVTTASGDRRRVEVGNDIATINADSVVRNSPIRTLSDLLNGRASGVDVERSNGTAGAPSKIRIRGVSSATLSNDPILIIDGVRAFGAVTTGQVGNQTGAGRSAPSRLDDIDPNSIESIDVLKGPSAASLYGTDAANGVIVIKTKRGQPGRARIDLSADYGEDHMPHEESNFTLGWGHSASDNVPIITCSLLNVAYGSCVQDSVTTFNFDNYGPASIVGGGYDRNVSGGISGGGQLLQERLGVHYSDITGMSKMDDLDKQRIQRAQPLQRIPEWMLRPNAEQMATVNSQTTMQPNAATDVSASINLVQMSQRNPGVTLAPSGWSLADTTDYTPGQQFATHTTDDVRRMYGAFSGSLRPTSWLRLRGTGGGDFTLRADRSLLLPSDCLTSGCNPSGSDTEWNGQTIVTSFDLGAALVFPLTSWLQSQTSWGSQYNRQHTTATNIAATGLAYGNTSANGAQSVTTTQTSDDAATAGIYVEQQFSLGNRLFVTGALRRDAGSAFGRDAKAPVYPKLSASWLLSQEPFFPWRGLFSSVRLRTAYGHAGVQPGFTDVNRIFTPLQVYNNAAVVTGALLSRLGNYTLKPERSAEWEGGFDITMLGDRVTLMATTYRKQNHDALVTRTLAPSLGATTLSRLENVGLVDNHGNELSAEIRLVQGPVLGWYFTVTGAQDRNKVVTLGPNVSPSGTINTRLVAGYPLFGRWRRPMLGFNDLDGNGIIGTNEIVLGDSAVYVGSTTPSSQLTYHTTVTSFGGALQLSASLQQETGVTQVQTLVNGVAALYDPHTSLADQAWAVYSFTNVSGATGRTESVSWLRLSEVTLSYTIPGRWAARLHASSATVALLGSNLGLWTRYRGVDPMVNSTFSGDQLTDAGTEIPQPRSWTIRLNLGY